MSTSPPPSQPPPVTTTTITTSSFPQSGQSHIVGIAAIAAPPTETTPAPVRKFPAPCWTQEETLALISSYQDKWYSLRRRNLRTADWEAVAEEVTRRVPGQTPPKTSAQCRHKMEKLRKRYRTEKQRIGALPNHGNNNNRFFGSSWVFFDLMNNLELGSSGSENNNNDNNNNNLLVGNNMNVPQISNVGKVDLEVKPYSMNNNMNVVKHDDNSKKGDLGKYFDEILLSMGNRNEKGKSQNQEFDVRSAPPHVKFKAKNNHERNYNHGYGGGDMSNEFDGVDEYGGGGGSGRNSGFSSGFKRKSSNYERYDEMHSPKMMPLNGPRKESGAGAGLGSRGRDSVVGEMVASIKMLGEGLVKMEKMKMEMMREIEQMRMQMEIKRSEMILESQHLIVSAFVEGMKNHKKVKAMEVE